MRKSAPALSRASTTSTCPSAAAHISAVCPLCSRALTSAPRASSASTGPSRPVRDAVISAVSPPGSALFGSAPASSSNSTIAVLPLVQASDRRRHAITVRRLDVGAGRDQDASPYSSRRGTPPSGAPSCHRPAARSRRLSFQAEHELPSAVLLLGGVGQRRLCGARCGRQEQPRNAAPQMANRCSIHVNSRRHALRSKAARKAHRPCRRCRRTNRAGRRLCRAASGADWPAAWPLCSGYGGRRACSRPRRRRR